MHRSVRQGAVAAAVLVLGLSACSGSSGTSEADIKAKIADQLAADGTLDEETADCFAGVIVDEIGVDKLKDVDFSATEPPEGLQEDFTSAAVKAIGECELDPSSIGNQRRSGT